jgi:hypothetical protein
MNLLTVVVFLLPALLAFIVLWVLDSALIRKVGNLFLTGLIEVCVALFIVAIGEGVVLYFLFRY